jgi:osmotically-inducible protein OsmY
MITVTTDGGKVKLTGTVHSWNERWTAGSTAWASPGATEVANDLIIA